jgi:lysophospholipase L1-like esterase
MDRRGFIQTLGVAALSAGATYWALKAPRGGSYLQMGTSVTSGVVPKASTTPAIVGDRLGMLGINAALPGACAGQNLYPHMEFRSLYCLVDAITSRDWTLQDAETEPNKAQVARLKTTDFTTVTYLDLEYGINDFRYARPIGSSGDSTRETFKGALNYSLHRLALAFPQLRLFLITPSWCTNFEDKDSDQYPNEIGAFLREYVDAMREIGAIHHVPCLDLWRTLGVNADNYKALTFDGVHPTPEGARRRGEVIASFIKATF